jgi:hypothetical protein
MYSLCPRKSVLTAFFESRTYYWLILTIYMKFFSWHCHKYLLSASLNSSSPAIMSWVPRSIPPSGTQTEFFAHEKCYEQPEVVGLWHVTRTMSNPRFHTPTFIHFLTIKLKLVLSTQTYVGVLLWSPIFTSVFRTFLHVRVGSVTCILAL